MLLTHAAWQRLFAGDPAALGRDVRINGIPRTVIGVLPRDFVGPMGETDFYFAFDLGPVLANPVTVRRSQWLGLVGRLKPGTAHEAAQRGIAAIWADLAREYPMAYRSNRQEPAPRVCVLLRSSSQRRCGRRSAKASPLGGFR